MLALIYQDHGSVMGYDNCLFDVHGIVLGPWWLNMAPPVFHISHDMPRLRSSMEAGVIVWIMVCGKQGIKQQTTGINEPGIGNQIWHLLAIFSLANESINAWRLVFCCDYHSDDPREGASGKTKTPGQHILMSPVVRDDEPRESPPLKSRALEHSWVASGKSQVTMLCSWWTISRSTIWTHLGKLGLKIMLNPLMPEMMNFMMDLIV